MLIKICGLHPVRDVQLCIALKVALLGFVFYAKSPRNINLEEVKTMGIKIIKAIKIKDQSDIENYKKYDNADIILFDTPGMEKSIEFPKDLISKLPKGDRYALAGSISIDNVENLTKLGVNFFDLSSSLETETKLGHKDHLKIQNFMKKINSINENSSI